MKLSKHLIKNNITQSLLALLIYIYTRFVGVTCKWEVKGLESCAKELENSGKIILAMWHGRIGVRTGEWGARSATKNYKLNAMVSAHSDGEFLTKIIQLYGYGIIRGSTGRQQGIKAYHEAIKALNNNESVVITPDGPRGPGMKVKGGIVKIAQETGAAIVPVSISVKNAKILNSWDKFMLPLPFSRGVIIYKGKIEVPSDANQDKVTEIEKKLEKELNKATKEADQYLGRNTI